MVESTVTALEMRKKFGGILDRVAKKGEHITIVRGNVPLATLVPATEHQQQCLERKGVIRISDRDIIEKWKREHPEALKRLRRFNSTDFIRKMRDTRWSSSTRR